MRRGDGGLGGGGVVGVLGGKQEPRKTSLLIGCFVTPATQSQRVYRKAFAETMFLLNPKDVISFSRWEICHSQGTACRESVLSVDASRAERLKDPALPDHGISSVYPHSFSN